MSLAAINFEAEKTVFLGETKQWLHQQVQELKKACSK